MPCMCKIIVRCVRVACCCGKASITYSESVSGTLIIQQVKRMRRTILSSVTCLALHYLSTLPHKKRDFREKVI